MDDKFANFTMTIMRLNKLMQKIKSFEIKEYGLKSIHIMCAYFLLNDRKGITAKELAEKTFEDKAAISRALGEMSKKGYIDYNPGGRNEIICLTPSGRRISEQICERAREVADIGSVLETEEQRNFFYDSLDSICANLENYYTEQINRKA